MIRLSSVHSLTLAIAIAATAGRTISAAPASLSISFTKTTVTVTGGAPGGRILIFSVAREPHRYYSETVRRVEMLSDAEGNGRALLTIPKGIPVRAVWVAVEVETGRYVLKATDGYEPQRMALPQAFLVKDAGGDLRKLSIPFGEIQALLFRPGVGAWWCEGAKNSALDENAGHDADLRLDIGQMHAIAEAPAVPATLRKGDFVFIIVPRLMSYFAGEVGE